MTSQLTNWHKTFPALALARRVALALNIDDLAILPSVAVAGGCCAKRISSGFD